MFRRLFLFDRCLDNQRGGPGRGRALVCAAIAAAITVALTTSPTALGKPGITPVPCPQQEWQYGDASFEPLPGAKAFFGRDAGGLYRIEIPASWNRELV